MAKYNIQLMNKISKIGTDIFDDKYALGEEIENPAGMLVRSAVLHDTVFPETLRCIARAGAGVNNIPLDRCADEGIVVFNTPGANANAVKELVLASLFLASRDIIGGVQWANTLEGDPEAAKKVEKGKSAFGGYEIFGKTLGIIGLGAIGRLVANAAVALGMSVVGCDPYLSDAARAELDPKVGVVATFEEVYTASDYITLHVPSTPTTKGMINAESIKGMKDGVRILNLARADLVVSADMLAALESGKIAKYVVDFPTDDVIGKNKNIVAIPHLGASTEEAEDNCAVMAVNQTIDYLENGNVKNSVNYPNLSLPRTAGANRVCVLAKAGIADAVNAAVAGALGTPVASASAEKGNYAYYIFDVKGDIGAIDPVSNVDGVIRVIAFI
ncbi:MAG: 3-phosphoglycerate dehydrogenase [Clostridia bacterium]|nr:3-phosphoglycerate dehydrogenase [Clostridia bacterium]